MPANSSSTLPSGTDSFGGPRPAGSPVGAGSYLDVDGREYICDVSPVAVGGEAHVFRCFQPANYLVKVLLAPNADLPARHPQVLRWISNLGPGLDSSNCELVVPLRLLEGNAGYVMEFKQETIPLQSLIQNQPNVDRPTGFLGMGGLRRRLFILRNLATGLEILHRNGFIHGDLSPANVLVEGEHDQPASNQVFLIDLDHLRKSGDPTGPRGTPGYLAPELRSGILHAPDTLTEAYSFAVMAVELLVPAICDMDLESVSLFGPESPPSVENQRRISIDSTGLGPLFEAALGDGKAESSARPTLADWRVGLLRACSSLLVCPRCGQAYCPEGLRRCAWGCGEAVPPHVKIRCRASSPDLRAFRKQLGQLGHEQVSEQTLVSANPAFVTCILSPGASGLEIDQAILFGAPPPDGNRRLLSLRTEDATSVIVKCGHGVEAWAYDERQTVIVLPRDREFQAPFRIHLGSSSAPSIVIDVTAEPIS